MYDAARKEEKENAPMMCFRRAARIVPVVVCAVLAHGGNALALVISTGDGTGNTMAPSDDPGFGHVGFMQTGTAVYLGNQWVLSVSGGHVPTNTLLLPNGNYVREVGSAVRLESPPELGLGAVPTDLKLHRIVADPGLPPLTIAFAPPPVGAEVVMIGTGRDRFAELKGWDVSGSGQNLVWTERTPPQAADIRGFSINQGSRTRRWGRNVIEDDTVIFPGDTDPNHYVVFDFGFGPIASMLIEFSENGIDSEATSTEGDSGGAVFYHNGTNWVLAGIIHTGLDYPNQPSAALMGNNQLGGSAVLFADLSLYRDQILEITGLPEPASATLLLLGGALGLSRRGKRETRR
ncbi:MAG: hypothetical protein CMJ18_03950 [Phycisphaeraceae bacterium]|nr:hypothetical protein [Phycisphaeraceae bacterium]